MPQAQLLEAGLALVVLVGLVVLLAGLVGYGRKRGGGSTRPSRDGRPRPRPRMPRPGPRASRPPAGPSRRDRRAPSRLPEPREIWWAEVPFEDGPGSKDRPCLVLRRGTGTATVLKITSKHHTERPGVLPLPPGSVGDRDQRASWLETDEAREVPLADFRRRVGTVDGRLWTRVQKAQA
jgi:mRNA-degrading endonuclease toxin of MazEF toxin-antitoxin module